MKGRAWFHNGFDAFYSVDSVHGLPSGQNRTSGLTVSDLSRFQVNLTPANILTASFLYNRADSNRNGLSILNPVETTTNMPPGAVHEHAFATSITSAAPCWMSGFADTRGLLRNPPQGDAIYEITPFGNRGNYFSGVNRHWYRQQATANLFLPTVHFHGAHQLKFGVDVERESFHQQVDRHDYEVLRDDNSVARLVTFAGDARSRSARTWRRRSMYRITGLPRKALALEGGVRTEWNEVVRDLEVAPRVAVAWAPRETARHQDSRRAGESTTTPSAWVCWPASRNRSAFRLSILPDGVVQRSGAHLLRGERPHALDAALPDRQRDRGAQTALRVLRQGGLHLAERHPRVRFRHRNSADRADVLRRRGLPACATRGTTATTLSISPSAAPSPGSSSGSSGIRGPAHAPTRPSDYSLENPVFAPQMPGPFAWDTPNRVHMWGWAPLPKRALPAPLEFLLRNTTAAYLVEYRTGFPFSSRG